MPSIFAKNFRFLREEKEITQTDMGEELGFSRASVDAYEDGRAMPPYPKLKIIADYFDYSIEEITEAKLWVSPIEKEIERNQSSIDFEEGLSDKLQEQLKAFNIDLSEKSSEKKELKSEVGIPFVKQQDFGKYLAKSWESISDSFQRIVFEMPENKMYMAFEAGDDFPINESVLIGFQIKNLVEIKDGERYLVITETLGFSYRRVFNLIRTKGVLILSGEVDNVEVKEIKLSEIKEVWKIEAFCSKTLPDPKQSTERAFKLAKELAEELKRLNNKN
jgi:transcriptional regulator with XRE-family HTH domain